MLGRIIEVTRWALYGLVIYNAVAVGWWVAVGFLLTFFYLEVSIIALTALRRQRSKLEELSKTLKQRLEAVGNTPQMDFGYEFSSEPLTTEEESFLEVAEKGRIEGIENFLASRCTDKSVDFTTVPIPVKLLMTAKVLAIVDNGKSTKTETEWADVIEDTSDNN